LEERTEGFLEDFLEDYKEFHEDFEDFHEDYEDYG
jgi:hypothetical protein